MAKAYKEPTQKKKLVNICECETELRWGYLVNNHRFVWICDKCSKYFDKQMKIVSVK